MTDDQPSGSCPTCSRRDPRRPQLCEVCRSRLRAWLFDIPSLYAELEERSEERSAPSDVRVGEVVVRGKYGGTLATVGPRDAVAYHLPSGASSSASRGGPISGSKERRLPIDTDAVDLTGPVRSAGTAVLDEDAVGYESVATVLDFWVEDWRAFRGAGERRPSATVPELTRWLLDRLDDAMDHSPSVDEFFHVVRRLRGALQARLGLVDIPDYKRGIPCPRCLALTLVHHSGADRVECGSCEALLSFLEYDEHVRSLSAEQVKARRGKVARIKDARRLLVAVRAAGWSRSVEYIGANGTNVKRADRVFTLLVWRRHAERIEVWIDCRSPVGSVNYSADEIADGMTVSVGVDWVEAYGIPALTRLARAAGILTAQKKTEVAA